MLRLVGLHQSIPVGHAALRLCDARAAAGLATMWACALFPLPELENQHAPLAVHHTLHKVRLRSVGCDDGACGLT